MSQNTNVPYITELTQNGLNEEQAKKFAAKVPEAKLQILDTDDKMIKVLKTVEIELDAFDLIQLVALAVSKKPQPVPATGASSQSVSNIADPTLAMLAQSFTVMVERMNPATPVSKIDDDTELLAIALTDKDPKRRKQAAAELKKRGKPFAVPNDDQELVLSAVDSTQTLAAWQEGLSAGYFGRGRKFKLVDPMGFFAQQDKMVPIDPLMLAQGQFKKVGDDGFNSSTQADWDRTKISFLHQALLIVMIEKDPNEVVQDKAMNVAHNLAKPMDQWRLSWKDFFELNAKDRNVRELAAELEAGVPLRATEDPEAYAKLVEAGTHPQICKRVKGVQKKGLANNGANVHGLMFEPDSIAFDSREMGPLGQQGERLYGRKEFLALGHKLGLGLHQHPQELMVAVRSCNKWEDLLNQIHADHPKALDGTLTRDEGDLSSWILPSGWGKRHLPNELNKLLRESGMFEMAGKLEVPIDTRSSMSMAYRIVARLHALGQLEQHFTK